MSSNETIFRVTGPLCGEFIGRRWVPAPRPVTQSLDVLFDLRYRKNGGAGDLRRHRTHYDVIVMHAATKDDILKLNPLKYIEKW